jgi:hypothetical protein
MQPPHDCMLLLLLRRRRWRVLTQAAGLADAKVAQLDHAAGGHKHIGGLQVAVQDALRMHVVQRTRHLQWRPSMTSTAAGREEAGSVQAGKGWRHARHGRTRTCVLLLLAPCTLRPTHSTQGLQGQCCPYLHSATHKQP